MVAENGDALRKRNVEKRDRAGGANYGAQNVQKALYARADDNFVRCADDVALFGDVLRHRFAQIRFALHFAVRKQAFILPKRAF